MTDRAVEWLETKANGHGRHTMEMCRSIIARLRAADALADSATEYYDAKLLDAYAAARAAHQEQGK